MKSSTLIKLVQKDGWRIVRTKGSHHHFKHPRKRGLVTIYPERFGLADKIWKKKW